MLYGVHPYIYVFNPFEFIFLYDVRKYSNVILLHIVVQFSQHHCDKTVFSPWYILASLVID